MIIPFIICGGCGNPYQTDSIFCPGCQKPLIKYCKKCGITEDRMKKLSLDTDPSTLSLTCNHIDRVDSPGTVAFYMVSPESLLVMIYSISFNKRLLCTRPSQIMALVEYCKATGVITPLTDLNSSRVWRDIGFDFVADEIASLGKASQSEPDVLKQCSIINTDEWKDNSLFHVHGINCMLV